MNFYELTHPQYDTDDEADSRNPATSVANYHVPGISCDVCGPWSSSNRLRIELPPMTGEFVGVTLLPVNEWRQRRNTWARMLKVDPDDITPGAELGPPIGVCASAIREDAVHPMPGKVWINSRVQNALVGARLTGVSYAKVHLAPECGKVDMWEVIAHGRAWRNGSTPENIQLCGVCGRHGFPSPMNLTVDELRWDGADFITLDNNPNTWAFAYDAFGGRVKRSGPDGTIVYIDDLYEKRSAAGVTKHVFHIEGADGKVGQVVYDESTGAEVLEYQVHDALGSTGVVFGSNGAVIERMFNEPFGARINADGSSFVAAPKNDEKVRLLIYYAENDAYPKWVHQRS